ncbi:MAG: NAD(P)-binding domain-containing protein [Patescibacteria group bacterium]
MATSGNNKTKIAIIGGGHIGSALAEGLLASGVAGSRLMIADRTPSRLRSLAKRRVRVTADAAQAAAWAEWVFIAVKPKDVRETLADLQPFIKGKLVVSLAAGIPVSSLRGWAHKDARLARAMPNIPIATGTGVVGLYAKGLGAKEHSRLRYALVGLGGVIETGRESDLETLTLIAGCGPGIAAYLVDLLAASARRLGLSAKTARYASVKTFEGAMTYLDERGLEPSELARSVATKGGVTEAILTRLTREKFPARFARAINAGAERLTKRRRV